MTSSFGRIYPQGGVGAFTATQRLDTRRGDELKPRSALNGGQKAANIGDTVPLIFTLYSGGIGGVWLSPPATEARFENSATSAASLEGKPTNFTNGVRAYYHLVLCSGQLGTISISDIYQGDTSFSVSTAPNYDPDPNVIAETLGTANAYQAYNTRAGSFTAGNAIAQKYLTEKTTTAEVNPVWEGDYGSNYITPPSGYCTQYQVKHYYAGTNSVICYYSSPVSPYSRNPDPIWVHLPNDPVVKSVTITKVVEPYPKPSCPEFCGTGGTYAGLTTLAVDRQYVNGSSRWNRQIHIFIRSGIPVTNVRTGGTAASSNFADITNYLLRLNDQVPADLVDLDLLKTAAAFTEAQGLYFNGIIATATNLRDFLRRTAPLFLLSVTQRNGKWGLVPLVPFNSSYQLYTGALTPLYTFTEDDIVTGTYRLKYTPLEERKPFCATMLWRYQPTNDIGQTKSTDVRYAGTALNGPFEQYDLSDFCVTEAHATKIGRYMLARRKHVTHTVEFSCLPNPSTSTLNPGDIVRVSLTRSASTGGDDVTASFFYHVTEVEEELDGSLRFQLLHCPTNASNQSLINLDIGGGSSSGGQAGPTTIGTVSITASVVGRPAPPTDLVVTPSYTELVLGWTAPAQTGGTLVNNYVVQYRATGATDWSTLSPEVGPATTALLPGLVPGTSYDFRVSAVTNRGQSLWSTTATASTSAIALNAPVSLTASGRNGGAQLTWAAPEGDLTTLFPPTDYVVQYRTSPSGDWTTFTDATSSATSALVTGLTNDTAYDFRVAAVSAPGQSAWSATATTTPFVPALPGAPTAVAATVVVVSGNASLTWTAPASSGTSPLLSYVVEVSLGASTAPEPFVLFPWQPLFLWTDDSASWDADTGEAGGTIGGSYTVAIDTLVPATVLSALPATTEYGFRVAAVTAVGQGPWSGPATITLDNTPLATPTAPRSLTLTPGNTQLTANWLAPTSAGTSAITDYLVQYRRYDSATWLTWADGVSTGTSTTITGLTNGIGYQVRVAAISAQGQGTWSGMNSAAPQAPAAPGAPSSLSGNPSTTSIALSWAAPSPGTSPITDYVIQYKLTSSGTWGTFTDGVGTGTSRTVTSLSTSTSYDFRIAAVSAVGQGAWSNTYTVSTISAASLAPPTNLQVTRNSGDGAIIAYTSPSVNVTSYLIQYKASSDYIWTNMTTTATSVFMAPFNYGTTYNFRVAANYGDAQSSFTPIVNYTV